MQPAVSDLATVTTLRQSLPTSEQFLNASDKIAAFPAAAVAPPRRAARRQPRPSRSGTGPPLSP